MTSMTSITIQHINTTIIRVDQIPINYEGINYYMITNNYNLDNIEFITTISYVVNLAILG
jgi:hypothetical protein